LDHIDYREQYMTIMANAMHGKSLFSAFNFLSCFDAPAPTPEPVAENKAAGF